MPWNFIHKPHHELTRLQFEKSFDPASYLTSFAPTMSPRRNLGSSKGSGKVFKKADYACPDVFLTSSPSSLSKATARRIQQTQKDASFSSLSATGGRSPSIRPGRGGRRPSSAPRLPPPPGSPVAASISSQSILRLCGALDQQHVPLDAGFQIERIRQEALSWSMIQMRHQCGRGLIVHMAQLLQVSR